MEDLGEGTWESLEEQLKSPGYYSELTLVLSQLRGHSEVHNDYTHDPLSFSNAPHIPFSPSSSGHHIPEEHLISSSDSGSALEQNDNLDTSLESQTASNDPKPRDASLRPAATSVISPVTNEKRPPETVEDSFKHVDHDATQNTQPILPISEAKRGSERSSHP